MGYKHQTKSYRTRHGVRYVCDQDICDMNLGSLVEQAKNRVKVLQNSGKGAFYEKGEGGSYYRVFVAAEGWTARRRQ